MRKHLYLITEHRNEERVGCVLTQDTRLTAASKDEELALHTYDEDEGDFKVAGQQVSMGYVDFEDEEDFDDRLADEIKRKLGEIDTEHLEKAGLNPQEVLADG